jgi:hypothetical protein
MAHGRGVYQKPSSSFAAFVIVVVIVVVVVGVMSHGTARSSLTPQYAALCQEASRQITQNVLYNVFQTPRWKQQSIEVETLSQLIRMESETESLGSWRVQDDVKDFTHPETSDKFHVW